MVRIKEWKRNGKKGWEVDLRITLPDGTRMRERVKSPVSSRSGTETWAKMREATIIEQGGRSEEKREPVPTLAEFWPRFIEGHCTANREKPSSVHAKQSIYDNHLAPRFGAVPLDRIGDEDVQRLKAALRDRSVKTINNVLTVLNRLLKSALEWGVIDRQPCRIRLLKAAAPSVEFYEPEIYEGLVAAAKEDDRVHVAVLLGGDAGLRLGEIIALEWTDVDFRRGQLTVRRSEWRGEVTLPKGGKERVVPMTRRLVATLGAHRHLRGPRVLVQDDASSVNRAWSGTP
jgi:integrase